MRFLKGFLPNLTIVLSIALAVLVYLDGRNPMMGFLYGIPFQVLVGVQILCAIASGVMLYIAWRKEEKITKKVPENQK